MASLREGDRRALRGARLRLRFWKTSRRRPEGLDPPVVDLQRITEGGLEREVVVKLPSDRDLRRATCVCPALYSCCTRATVGVWLEKYRPEMIEVAYVVNKLNAGLRERFGPHLQVGPSYFMREDLNENLLRRVWDYDVMPFLEDQLLAQEEELEKFKLN